MNIGSAVDLHKRLKLYFSITFLTNSKGNSNINRALLHHGYSKFSLSILVPGSYIDITNLSKEEKNYLRTKREQYFLDTLTPE